MSLFDDHPAVLFGGLIGSPIGGGLLAYLTRVETGCLGSPDLITGVSSGPCTYEYNPGAGAVATLVGWGITGIAVAVLEKRSTT